MAVVGNSERKECWQKWIDKAVEMAGQVGQGSLAAPLVSVAPPSYHPDRIPSVLYIGKATRGAWGEDGEISPGLLRDWKAWTPESLDLHAAKWLSQYIWNRGWPTPGPFWYFARSLSQSVSNYQVPELQNLVWTNIAKIGVKSGNPHGQFLQMQIDLSVETIEFEIRHYKPQLVFWATGDFAEEVVDRVAHDRDRTNWEKDTWRTGRCWWRLETNGMPAMIWAMHPQGKERDVLDIWEAKARELVS